MSQQAAAMSYGACELRRITATLQWQRAVDEYVTSLQVPQAERDAYVPSSLPEQEIAGVDDALAYCRRKHPADAGAVGQARGLRARLRAAGEQYRPGGTSPEEPQEPTSSVTPGAAGEPQEPQEGADPPVALG